MAAAAIAVFACFYSFLLCVVALRTVLPAVSTIVVSSSTLTNCQQASIMYIYYLQGKIALGPADLNLAVKTISIARGSYSLSDPWASQYFWPYQDDIQFYGGVIPNQPPPSPPPPPPTLLSPPPSLPPPPPPGERRGAAQSALFRAWAGSFIHQLTAFS